MSWQNKHTKKVLNVLSDLKEQTVNCGMFDKTLKQLSENASKS
jgi:hypothetical protein